MNISVRKRGQHTARRIVVDLWQTDHLDHPYQFYPGFDSIPQYKKFGTGVSVRKADRKGVRGTQVEFN